MGLNSPDVIAQFDIIVFIIKSPDLAYSVGYR